MKNILFIICMLLSPATVIAQITKGSSTVGGNLSLSRQKIQYGYESPSDYRYEYKERIFSFTPDYGYFVVNNLCVGVNATAFLSRVRYKPSPDSPEIGTRSRSLGAGPVLRYYVPLDSKFYVFATGSYTWVRSESEYDYLEGSNNINTTTTKNSYRLGAVGLGLSYFVSPSAALETGVTYTQANYKDEGGNSTQTTRQLALSLGFRVYLRKP